MQVSAASSLGHELTMASAKAEGRSQRLVSEETFGKTRAADSFQSTLSGQLRPAVQTPTYAAEVAKKPDGAKPVATTQTLNTETGTPTETPESVQFTQNDIENLTKIFGSTVGDGNFMSQYDLDGSGTINLQDLNAMLAQIASAEESGGDDAATSFTQADIDLLLESFGAQAGDDNYSDALDLDGDGIIGLADLNTMLANLTQPEESQGFTQSHIDQLTAALGANAGDENFIAELDLNGDGTLNLADLNQLLASLSA